MRIRILHLWISLLCLNTFGCASDTTLDSIQEQEFHAHLQRHINNALESYKNNIQSQKYSAGTFSEVYNRTLLALQESIKDASEFFMDYKPVSLLALAKPSTLSNEPTASSNQPINNFIETNKEEMSSLIVEAKTLWESFKNISSEIYAPLKIPQRKIGNLRKNLLKAIETTEAFEVTLMYVSHFFYGILPGYSQEVYHKAIQPYIALHQWRKKSCHTAKHMELNAFFSKDFIQKLLESIHQTGRINLISFICPPLDFEQLKSDNPENYLLTTTENSLISKHISYFRLLVENLLIPTGIDIRLIFMIGDSDEDDYIWAQENSKPATLDEKKLNKRRTELLSNITKYVSDFLPSVQIEVYSLHHYLGKNADTETYEEMFHNYQKYFSESDIKTEFIRMLELWENGNYYSKLPYPGEISLNTIIKAKFAAYAVHGLIAHKIMPTAILCQTEFPLKLRTDMLNAGRKYREKGQFPVLYLLNEPEKKNKKPFPK